LPLSESTLDKFVKKTTGKERDRIMNQNQSIMKKREEKVYVLDENSHAVALLEKELTHFNVEMQIFENLEASLKEIKHLPPDLLMLDPVKIGSGNFEIIQSLKSLEELKGVPFLVHSQSIPEETLIKSFEFGGDDFLSKPVKIGEAVSRIRGLLRRKKMIECSPEEALILVGPLAIDFNNREVKTEGRTCKLTSTEIRILKALTRKPGTVVSRKNLIEAVWHEDRIVEEQNLDVHIFSIRKKIEANHRRPEIILTLRGIGYKMNSFE
jgi:DNA-binding response OmpR family regulator